MKTSDSTWSLGTRDNLSQTLAKMSQPRRRAMPANLGRIILGAIFTLSCLAGFFYFSSEFSNSQSSGDPRLSGNWLLAATGKALDPRLDRVASLSIDQQRELLRKKEAFYRLSEEEQKAFHQFHQQLVKHPQSDRLQGILNRYYNWLKTLDERTKSALLDNPQKSVRVTKIRELREAQGREISFLPESDHQQFDLWLKELAERKSEEVRQVFRDFRRRAQLPTELTDQSSPDLLVRVLLRADRSGETMRRLVTPADLEALKGALSDAAKSIMNEEKVRSDFVLFNFIRNPYVSPEELEQFYFKELTSEQRDGLDKMPPDQMKTRLRLMYQLKQIGVPKEQWLRGLNTESRRRS